MTETATRPARMPPRWFVRVAWLAHRGLYRLTGGRKGLRRPKPGGWGTARLTTIGRKSGEPRSVMIGYYEDGPSVVTLAMNGWAPPEPAWWLNLQANPEATLERESGEIPVRGRIAVGDERDRLWDVWREIDDDLDAYAARRPTETAVVVLEPMN